MNKKLAFLMCSVLLAAATLGCGTISVPTLNVGALQEESHSLGLEGATSADVQLFVGTGELKVSPGADGLMQATFRYNVSEWKPQLERSKVGELASVRVQQGSDKNSWGIAGQGARNEWDVRLGSSVPIRLTVGMGAGSSTLELGGLQLARLDVDGGAGDTTVSFDAPNPEALSKIDINSGAGKVELRAAGNANFETMSVKGGAGEVSLDFTGNWTRSASVEVIAGIGKVSVSVPRSIGVKVKTTSSPVGKLIVEGLSATDGGYANEAYGTSDIQLDISLTTGIGEVTLSSR